jgi:hypothetical protein
MNSKSELMSDYKSTVGTIISWVFGFVFLLIGLINTFWGNDLGYGIFIILLSLIFFSPVSALVKRITGFNIPWFVKVLLGMFIIWTAMGVGELPAKIEMMLQSFNQN